MSIKEMKEYLEEEYENAGYADFYERVLKNMSDEEVERLYNDFENSFKKLEEEYKSEKEQNSDK